MADTVYESLKNDEFHRDEHKLVEAIKRDALRRTRNADDAIELTADVLVRLKCTSAIGYDGEPLTYAFVLWLLDMRFLDAKRRERRTGMLIYSGDDVESKVEESEDKSATHKAWMLRRDITAAYQTLNPRRRAALHSGHHLHETSLEPSLHPITPSYFCGATPTGDDEMRYVGGLEGHEEFDPRTKVVQPLRDARQAMIRHLGDGYLENL